MLKCAGPGRVACFVHSKGTLAVISTTSLCILYIPQSLASLQVELNKLLTENREDPGWELKFLSVLRRGANDPELGSFNLHWPRVRLF